MIIIISKSFKGIHNFSKLLLIQEINNKQKPVTLLQQKDRQVKVACRVQVAYLKK